MLLPKWSIPSRFQIRLVTTMSYFCANSRAHLHGNHCLTVLQDNLAAAAASHAALVAALQSEMDQLSELQLATAATALALEEEKDALKRQLAAAEGQLAALSGNMSTTIDKEREAAAEVAACREEIERWENYFYLRFYVFGVNSSF